MENKVKLSIIVPAYNDEEYISRCLESVQYLAESSYEIIVIDDGSKDHTGHILDEFSLKNPHIIVEHKKNGGLRSARLAGLTIARGEYISFLDSDDWVDAGYYEYLIQILEENPDIDICTGAIVRNNPYGDEYPYYELDDDSYIEGSRALDEMIFGSRFKWEISSKLYRHELFERWLPQNNIKVCEDLDWNWELFKGTKGVFYTSKYLYHYYYNAGSMTQNRGIEALTQHLVYDRIIADSTDASEKIKQFFLKAYCKMIPRLILELISKEELQSEDLEMINTLQNGLKDKLTQLSDYSFLSTELHSALVGATSGCVNYFVNWINDLRGLMSKIPNGSRYIYGTGFIAEYISRWYELYPIEIKGYVVSDGQPNPRRYKGKRVYFLSEILDGAEEPIFILAMVERVQVIVEELLIKKGFSKNYRLNTDPFCDG